MTQHCQKIKGLLNYFSHGFQKHAPWEILFVLISCQGKHKFDNENIKDKNFEVLAAQNNQKGQRNQAAKSHNGESPFQTNPHFKQFQGYKFPGISRAVKISVQFS